MKICSVVGARPQFVKLAPLSRRIRTSHSELIIHTGQHYSSSMSDQIFADLGLAPPDYSLAIGSDTHGVQTGRMIAALEPVLAREKPDAVIVFGDTNTTLAGAIASVKLGIPTVHVEAGLRSFNRAMPEEINRVITDHCADHLFAPTRTAMMNLDREGLSSRAHLTGDIMVDTLAENRDLAATRSTVLSDLGLTPGTYTLLTLHRPYNVDDVAYTPHLLGKLADLGDPVVFPVHPRTRAVMDGAPNPVPHGVTVCEPIGYLDFVHLESHAKRIVTDSGGVQKEAYLLGVPCITVRPETEWLETVEAGWNFLADPQDESFAERVRSFKPNGDRAAVFGEDVANQMMSLLERILAN